MRFQRAELHNHTNESDGSLTAKELMNYAAEHHFGVIALTDHNLVSGQRKAEKIIQDEALDLALIKGVEVTTTYGHILGLGMETMFDFIDVNPYQPEKLFRKMREHGAQVVGIAHPYVIGNPVMTGCRLYMEIQDYNEVDYIEVFNTAGGDSAFANQLLGNYKALALWEEKVLAGYNLAAVSGKDLHNIPADEAAMITYALLEEESNLPLGDQVIKAIQQQKTFVTKGPLVEVSLKDQVLSLRVDNTSTYYDWQQRYKTYQPLLVVRDQMNHEFSFSFDFNQPVHQFEMPSTSERFTARIYESEAADTNLLAAGILIKREEENL